MKKFLYWFQIHPKPRGNWRPKLEIYLKIEAKDFPHNPLLPNFQLRTKENTDNSESIVYNEQEVILYVNSFFFVFPNRRESASDDKLTLINKEYLIKESRNSLECHKSCYLGWRPGVSPDYSDIQESLKLIPSILKNLLNEGLDSGETQNYRYEFNGFKETSKNGNDGIRKIK